MNDDTGGWEDALPLAGAARPEAEKKSCRSLTGSTAAKAAAFLLVILMAALTAAGAAGAVLFSRMEVYTTPKYALKEQEFTEWLHSDAREILRMVRDGNTQAAALYCDELNLAYVGVSGGGVTWSYAIGTEGSFRLAETFRIDDTDYQVELVLSERLGMDDVYALVDRLIDAAYALRYWVYVISGAALLLSVACFVFLMCASGRHRGEDAPRPGWGTGVPLDLLTAGLGLCWLALFALYEELIYGKYGVGVICAAAVAAVAALLGWCMSVAVRLKLGGWWKNTLIYRVLARGLRLAIRLLGWLRRGVSAVPGGAVSLVGRLPLVWKTALGCAVLTAAELFCQLATWYDPDVLLCFWLAEKLLLVPAVLYFALTMRRLQKAGEALAAGDLSYQADTRHMIWSFKAHGENLNSIALGMNRAVEQRLKSERLKTELITNVSHDIKTPLTSIINYAGLIGSEPCENETITEYAGVLLRQSERLKKLIEDLVEASKASTGNLDVTLAPCEAGVLLIQAAGEYQQRLDAAGLELVTRQPEHPVVIMADGRRLWRVFDNLMNNICKYAQRGTRVYLTLEERDGAVLISFKNTSHSALDVPAEELLERFSRGDASRSTEGNGLGLSIAQSLTELQKGKLELTVDGDLFKVVLRFPAARREAARFPAET